MQSPAPAEEHMVNPPPTPPHSPGSAVRAVSAVSPAIPAIPAIPDGAGGNPRAPASAAQVTAVLLTVAALYLGRDIFVPFALAVLLGFLLDPLVTRLRRVGLPRALAVGVVMVSTVAVLGATALFVAGQVMQLSKDLPTYQNTMQQKLRDLRSLTRGHSVMDDATRLIDAVGGELDAAKRDLENSGRARPGPAPMRVQLEPTPRTALQTLGDWLAPAMAPVATAGIVLVFLIFILFERNDMRDRLLRLVGGNLHHTTDALGEAGERVSRYLGMQLLVNLSYGVPMALGLWLIGVPGAVLWGLVAALLRFVPYLGPVIAAAFPLALALAVDPGWQMLGWTLALVLTLELVSNNLVEPWLYGASTGLSAVSIIVSAVVWTALWGPVGLILATPLTVCLAVLGRHLPPLRWLDVLLGNAPVFDPPTRLYQRLLAGDVAEAVELANEAVQQGSVQAFYSDTAVPALHKAVQDHGGVARVEHRHRVTSGMAQVIADLREEHPPEHPPAGTSPGADAARAARAAPPRLLCIGAQWELDTLAADMLGHALALDGIASRVLPATAVSADQIQSLDLAGVQLLCLSIFSATPQAQVRYISRRLKRRAPALRIVAALWHHGAVTEAPPEAAALGVDAVACSLAEASARLTALLDGLQAALPANGANGANGATAGGALLPADGSEADPFEAERLRALADSGALDPALRAPLDHAAQRTAEVFGTALAMVSLVSDSCQVWQGAAGLDPHLDAAARSTPRDLALGGQLAVSGQRLVVDDMARDPRFSSHPLVGDGGLRFYASAPLRTAGGQVIGALCVVDHQPRSLGPAEQQLLEAMADDVMALINSHRAERQAAAADALHSDAATWQPGLPRPDVRA